MGPGRDTLPFLPAPRPGGTDAVTPRKAEGMGRSAPKEPQALRIPGQERQKTGSTHVPGQGVVRRG